MRGDVKDEADCRICKAVLDADCIDYVVRVRVFYSKCMHNRFVEAAN